MKKSKNKDIDKNLDKNIVTSFRVNPTDYEKSIINTKARLPADRSGPMTHKKLNPVMTTILYDKHFDSWDDETDSIEAVAKYVNQDSIDIYYLRFNKDNILLDINDKVHMNGLANNKFMWRKVTKDSFTYYSDFLKSSPSRYSSYDAAKSGFLN